MFEDNPYFRPEEFESPDMPGSGEEMNREFIRKLTKARELAKIPFTITSGFRTSKHNYKVGGVDTSSHLIGRACDISVTGARDRFIILRSLMMVGFHRIGIGANFIHVDDDPDKAINVIWDYYK